MTQNFRKSAKSLRVKALMMKPLTCQNNHLALSHLDAILLRDDVVEECNKHGEVMHIYVDKASPQGDLLNREMMTQQRFISYL